MVRKFSNNDRTSPNELNYNEDWMETLLGKLAPIYVPLNMNMEEENLLTFTEFSKEEMEAILK